MSDAIQPSHPLLSPSPPLNIFQHQGLFQSWLFTSIRCPKYWSSSFSISPSSVYSGFISLRIDWFDLFALQGLSRVFCSTSLKASFLWHSAFFTVQLSHPSVTTAKTIALTVETFVGKVMSLLFNTCLGLYH